jgi:succinate dehydrogenase / fumarate reductase, cytochrome b subunit
VEISSVRTVAAPSSSFIGRNQFLIYRLFSLAGLIPVGGYMTIHLLTNATILDSPATFQKQVNTIHSLGIILPVVEWTFIFIPILFHAIIGSMIIAGAVPNTNSYPYANNIRYTMQRVTGIVAFFFIAAHIIHLHHLGSYVGGGKFDPHHAASSAGNALTGLSVQLFYAIGMLSCVYHLANGLWTFGITWGIWTTPRAQKRANLLSILLGCGLAVVGLSALWGMSTVNVKDAEKVEDRLIRVHEFETGKLPLPGEAVATPAPAKPDPAPSNPTNPAPTDNK